MHYFSYLYLILKLAPFILVLSTTKPAYASRGIDTSRLERYLLETTIINKNESTKYIVNSMWIGLTRAMNFKSESEKMYGNACWTALDSYINAVINKQELWALKMYDASSGTQPGFLTGNIQDIGSYDECVGVSMPYNPPMYGKYCTVVVKENMSAPFIMEDSVSGVPVSYALCVPSVCDAEDVEDILNEGAIILNQTLPFEVVEEKCYTRQRRSLETGDWFAIFVLGSVISLTIISTTYDTWFQISSSSTKQESFILAFSLQKHLRQLTSVSSSQDSMSCIFGLRFMMIVWIIAVHRFSQLRTVPAMSMFQQHVLVQDWTRAAIVNAYIAVDTFFVVSGTLLSYSFARKIEAQQESFTVLKFYLHRYFRITPALAGIILFYATVSDLLCEGPMCRLFYETVKKPCMKNWWTTLLYINNYYDSDVMCVVQTWYLSVDMQLFLLSPVILYPMIYKPKIVPYLLASFYGVALSVSLLQPYFNNIAAGYFIVGKYTDHKIFLENYVLTHTRAGSWILGFALGIYIDDYKRAPKVISKKQIALGWALTLVAFVSVIFGILPFQQANHEYSQVWDTLYKSLHRHVWALATCWLIFACSIGRGGFVNSFLSWGPIFQPLGRLTYCIYLVHILVLKLQMGAQRTPVNFSDITRVTIACGDVAASIIVASLLYLLFEAPGCSLERLFLGADTKKRIKPEATDRGIELFNRQSMK